MLDKKEDAVLGAYDMYAAAHDNFAAAKEAHLVKVGIVAIEKARFVKAGHDAQWQDGDKKTLAMMFRQHRLDVAMAHQEDAREHMNAMREVMNRSERAVMEAIADSVNHNSQEASE